MPFDHARPTCLMCGSATLQPLLWIKREGIPHAQPGHNYSYSSITLVTCARCGHGQMEHYSHDCWSYYEDEDWDMYWWYVLEPADVAQLRSLLGACPTPLKPDCTCSVHQALQSACHPLYSGIKHAISAHEQVSFAYLSLIVKEGRPGFNIKRP